MSRLFGTDGVRGIAGKEITCELAYNLGRGGAHVLTYGTHHPKILVGMDTRLSGDMLSASLCAGICSTGASALVVGVIPTPAIAYLTKKYNADAGVVISASHNPMEFNGIKFFNQDGFKLSDAVEDSIEELINNSCINVTTATGSDVGRIINMDNAKEDYIDYIISKSSDTIADLKVVIDCANGSASDLAGELYAKLGVDVIPINCEPNGININDRCGSTHLEELKRKIVDENADIGIAFDGDADRMLAVDENGNIIDGDKIMAICARELKRRNKLKNNTLVITIMSNLGLSIFAKENDINLEVTKVGDRYVLEKMIEEGYNLGGEQSGHVIFIDDNTTGDGMLSGMRLLESLKKNACKASELGAIMKVLPQILVNVKVINAKKNSYIYDEEIMDFIGTLEKKYAGKGRVLVRPSGTEPLVRVMIEGEDQDIISEDAQDLADLIDVRLN